MKNRYLLLVAMMTIVTACNNDKSSAPTPDDTALFTNSQSALMALYSDAESIEWQQLQGYQVATFYTSSINNFLFMLRSEGGDVDVTPNSQAWFYASAAASVVELVTQQLGDEVSTLPPAVQSTFSASEYGDSSVWSIEQVEVDSQYASGSVEKMSYVVRVESESQREMLLLDGSTGAMLLSVAGDAAQSGATSIAVNSELQSSVESSLASAQSIEILYAELLGGAIYAFASVEGGAIYQSKLDPTTYSVEASSEI